MQAPVMVLTSSAKRETGRKAQLSNIAAAKTVADIIRTTLGPRAMLKMILDPMGGITMTNDGNAILREIDVSHPAAKSMLELARTQDEEVGDGTTSVIILAGELLEMAQPHLERNMHPRIIVFAYNLALDEALAALERLAKPLDTSNREAMLAILRTCLGTKFVSKFGDLVSRLALDGVLQVTVEGSDGKKVVDTKNYARVEKVPGGYLEDSRVLDGVMLNKDVVHPKMPRHVENPRIILLDCPLEYKKGESQTNVEITDDVAWNDILRQEEEYVEQMCKEILKHKPDIVVTEKGCADIAQHFLMKAGVACLRRVRKTDNNRIARAVGATIVNEPSEIKEHDVGKGCGLFDVRKIGDEYFSFFEKCQNPKACTILLRGASKDILSEIERNLQDAMGCATSIMRDPRVLPGGGATEMAVAHAIREKAKQLEDAHQWPFKTVAGALEIIPRTLIENCGGDIMRCLTSLRAAHSRGEWYMGIDGEKGVLADMTKAQILEPFVVKSQTFKTAIEAACMLLRIDDIVSGISKKSAKPQSEVHNYDEEEEAGAMGGNARED